MIYLDPNWLRSRGKPDPSDIARRVPAGFLPDSEALDEYLRNAPMDSYAVAPRWSWTDNFFIDFGTGWGDSWSQGLSAYGRRGLTWLLTGSAADGANTESGGYRWAERLQSWTDFRNLLRRGGARMMMGSADDAAQQAVKRADDAAAGAAKGNAGALNKVPDDDLVPKNVFEGIKKAPNYPEGFTAVQNGTTKNAVSNKALLDKLREIEPGDCRKVYKDGFDGGGNKVSIHYFESRSGKVFDVDVKQGWSN